MRNFFCVLFLLNSVIGVAQNKSYNIGTPPQGIYLDKGSSELGNWEIFLNKTSSDFLSFGLICSDNSQGLVRFAFAISRLYINLDDGQEVNLSANVILAFSRLISDGDITSVRIKVDDQYIYPINPFINTRETADGLYLYSLSFDVDESLIDFLGNASELSVCFFHASSRKNYEFPVQESFIKAVSNF